MATRNQSPLGVTEEVTHDSDSFRKNYYDGRWVTLFEATDPHWNQCAVIQTTSEIVVRRFLRRFVLGIDAALRLSEHRCDGPRGIEYSQDPGVGTEVHDAKNPPRLFVHHHRHVCTNDLLDARRRLDRGQAMAVFCSFKLSKNAS